MSDNKCGPCSGSGKRHSIFDFCNCNQKCEDLGVCGACDGSGAMSDNKTEKRWMVEVDATGKVYHRGYVCARAQLGQWQKSSDNPKEQDLRQQLLLAAKTIETYVDAGEKLAAELKQLQDDVANNRSFESYNIKVKQLRCVTEELRRAEARIAELEGRT